MNKSSGDFGKLAKNYKAIRPAYPAKVIKDIYSLIKNPRPAVLDLGCGTGISTRQLAKRGTTIYGCDIDEQMLAHTETGAKNITYVKGSAGKLPFEKHTFDAVTMFAAFHWFSTKKALNEIRRVLKPGGIVCIVQPRNTSPTRDDHKKIIDEVLKTNVKVKYSNKSFEELLAQSSYRIVTHKIYKVVNRYTLEQFLKSLQSRSIWNQVPTSKRKRILALCKAHFRRHLEDGVIYDTADLHLICAKPKSRG